MGIMSGESWLTGSDIAGLGQGPAITTQEVVDWAKKQIEKWFLDDCIEVRIQYGYSWHESHDSTMDYCLDESIDWDALDVWVAIYILRDGRVKKLSLDSWQKRRELLNRARRAQGKPELQLANAITVKAWPKPLTVSKVGPVLGEQYIRPTEGWL